MSEATDLLEYISNENNKLIDLLEAGGPKVGVFYLLDKIHWHGIPVKYAEDSGPYKRYPFNHVQYWDILKDENPAITKGHDVYYYPRGRVTYDTETKKYELAIDKHIDDTTISEIIRLFNLPEDKISTVYDVHYQCFKCSGRGE